MAGAIVPYAIPFSAIDRHGVDFGAFAGGIFANPATRIFSADAMMASAIFFVFVLVEGRRCRMRRLWPYPLLVIVFGLACAMPTFVAMREHATPL